MLKKYQVLLLVLLAYIILGLYFPSITANFVNLDDNVMVLGNDYIKSLSFSSIKDMFSSSYYKLYHPLVTLSYAVEYCFCKLDPYLYHIDNIFLHILNTLLLFFIIRKFSKSFWVPYFVSLIFAIHPVHIEAVTWISARKDTLYSFFFLLSLLFYIKSDDDKENTAENNKEENKEKNIRRENIFYWVSVAAFVLSCFCKATAVTLPLFLILADFSRNKLSFSKIEKYIPFFIISGIFVYIAIACHYSVEEKIISTFFFKYVNFISSHINILFYIYKFLFPLKLSVLYPYFFDNHTMMPWFVLYAPFVLYTAIFFVFLSIARTKKIFFGFMFFFLALIPSSGIMPTGVAPVADRYAYLAIAGLAYILVEFLFFSYKKYPKTKIYVIAFSVVFASFLMYLTYTRNIIWRDSVKLMDEAVNYSPQTANHAYLTRGIILKGKKELEQAEADLNKSYKINRDNVTIFFHLAHLKQVQEKYDEAVKLYMKIPESFYDYAVVVNNLGQVLGEQEKYDKAISLIKKYLAKNGEDKNSFAEYLYSNLALLYFKQEKYDESLKYVQLACKKNPSAAYYLQMMVLYDKKNDFENFEKTAFEGLKKSDNNVLLLNELANKYFMLERYEDVEKLLVKERGLLCENHFGYFLLGNLSAMRGYFKSALIYYTMAIFTAKDNPYGQEKDKNSEEKQLKEISEYYFKRAAVYLILGDYEQAKTNMEAAQKRGFVVDEDFIAGLEELRESIESEKNRKIVEENINTRIQTIKENVEKSRNFQEEQITNRMKTIKENVEKSKETEAAKIEAKLEANKKAAQTKKEQEEQIVNRMNTVKENVEKSKQTEAAKITEKLEANKKAAATKKEQEEQISDKIKTYKEEVVKKSKETEAAKIAEKLEANKKAAETKKEQEEQIVNRINTVKENVKKSKETEAAKITEKLEANKKADKTKKEQETKIVEKINNNKNAEKMLSILEVFDDDTQDAGLEETETDLLSRL